MMNSDVDDFAVTRILIWAPILAEDDNGLDYLGQRISRDGIELGQVQQFFKIKSMRVGSRGGMRARSYCHVSGKLDRNRSPRWAVQDHPCGLLCQHKPMGLTYAELPPPSHDQREKHGTPCASELVLDD